MSLLTDRRSFFKIIGATTAGVATTACGSNDALIPLLVPEHNIPIGEEQWHPAVCTECAAGCGTLVRIMGAERVIDQKGEKVRQRIAAVKKIEGNPLDPISGGRLCARGQAVVQALYHPDRLHTAMKRNGNRGTSQFTSVSWDDAIAAASQKIHAADPSRIVFLTGPNAGSRSVAIRQFLKAIKAPAATVCSLADFAIEREAAEQALGWKGLPVYDIANATHVLSVGADFLGGWASPVYYARQFGNFRQGRPGIRGNLFHAESRFSITAGSADRWLPILPGTEPQFIAAVSRFITDQNASDVPAMLKACGLEQQRTLEILREFANSKAPLVVGGASAVHTNSLEAVVASLQLNQKLGNIGKPGGVLAPAASAVTMETSALANRLANAQVILIDGANPVYTMPKSSGIADALNRAETVISFAPIIDDSAIYADFILPDHHSLESSVAVAPIVSDRTGLAVAEPFVLPLYDTRALEKTLSGIAAYTASTPADLVKPLLKGDATYEEVAREGGLWLEPDAKPIAPKPGKDASLTAATFTGDAAQFPLFFQPYLSLQFHDGSSSHLPWMQELPDPTSSAIWSIPVELDAKTANSLGIADGDLIRVESPNGAIEAPAFIHPAAIPGVVSMAIGAGHTHFGRYASDRGANPLSILAPATEQTTGAIATGATRVKLTRVSDAGRLIQFSTQKREDRNFAYR
jgi:anaerobic selenocysteine-containing dehydrogenase